MVLTTETFRDGWLKMRERISVRLIGIYFGYVKAYTMLSSLSDFEATVGYIPFATEYAPKEWCTLINTMIEKKGKINLVKDLYTINLIEADFNFNNKVIARLLIRYVEKNKLILAE